MNIIFLFANQVNIFVKQNYIHISCFHEMPDPWPFSMF